LFKRETGDREIINLIEIVVYIVADVVGRNVNIVSGRLNIIAAVKL